MIDEVLSGPHTNQRIRASKQLAAGNDTIEYRGFSIGIVDVPGGWTYKLDSQEYLTLEEVFNAVDKRN